MRRECRERFPPPPNSKETARAVMHVGIAHPRWRGNVPGIPGACASAILRIWQEAHALPIKTNAIALFVIII